MSAGARMRINSPFLAVQGKHSVFLLPRKKKKRADACRLKGDRRLFIRPGQQLVGCETAQEADPFYRSLG
jgi:hypothetical protein